MFVVITVQLETEYHSWDDLECMLQLHGEALALLMCPFLILHHPLIRGSPFSILFLVP